MSKSRSPLAIDGAKPVRDTYLPYGKHDITDEDIAEVTRVLRGDWLTTGPDVDAFEDCLAGRVRATSAAAVSSGTAALHLAYLAAGIGPGDEVVTSSLTFAATANAALYVGARPVFADVDPLTMNLDPAKAEAAITDKTRAIVAVHYCGRSCEMKELRDICDRHGLLLIEDACHALGAYYGGQPVGSALADLSCWSFHPVKHIAAGEGGAVTSPSREDLIESIRRLRNHGINRDARERFGASAGWAYQIDRLGFNYRIPDINCALASSQLKRLDASLARRRELAARFDSELAALDGLILPATDDSDHLSAWHLYVVRIEGDSFACGREEIFAALRAENIGVNVHYIPVHWHPLYESLGYPKSLTPRAEEAYGCMITLPLFGVMSDSDASDVIEATSKVLDHYRR